MAFSFSTMKEYPKEQLDDPRWISKRNSILTRDKNTCIACCRNDLRMHVHHLKYLPYKDLWDYPDNMLVTYCEICHNTEHLIGDAISESLYELLDMKKIYVKQLAQLTVLIEKYPPLYRRLQSFLNEMIIEYQRQREAEQKLING